VLAPSSLHDVGKLVAEHSTVQRERARPLAELIRRDRAIRLRDPVLLSRWPTRGCSHSTRAASACNGTSIAFPRQELQPTTCGSYGREAERSLPPPRKPKQLACWQHQPTLPWHGSRTTEEAIHAHSGAVRAGSSFRQEWCLQVPARPDPAGGLFADCRRAPCGSPPTHRPRAVRSMTADDLAEICFDVA